MGGGRCSVVMRVFSQGAVQAMAAAITGHQQNSPLVFTALHVLLPFVSCASPLAHAHRHAPDPRRLLALRTACTARLRWTERCRRWPRWVSAARKVGAELQCTAHVGRTGALGRA